MVIVYDKKSILEGVNFFSSFSLGQTPLQDAKMIKMRAIRLTAVCNAFQSQIKARQCMQCNCFARSHCTALTHKCVCLCVTHTETRRGRNLFSQSVGVDAV